MNKKSFVVAGLLAGAVFAAVAAPTKNIVGTDTTVGVVDYTTDYSPGTDGNVTWTVPATQPVGSYDVFTDTYDFTLQVGNDVTAYAQVVNSKNYALTGAAGELQLYEGTYKAGTALSSYTLVDQASFSTGIDPTLVDHLAAGNYFYAVEGTTAGSKGGRYYFEVTAVPEPTDAALLLVGLGLLGTMAKRRKVR